MQKDKERDNSELKTQRGEIVSKASTASLSSQKGKNAPNKNKKINQNRNKKKPPLK